MRARARGLRRSRLRRSRKRPLAVRLLYGLLAAAGAVAVVWAGGFLWFAANVHREVADPDLETDAIVVLTGGSGRLETGFTLLGEGRARKLFVSGVDPATTREQIRRLAHHAPERFDCCVALGHAARDTVGNAVETAAWMREQAFASLRLVTGSYHMPRSLLEFRRVMPGVTLVPHPVFPEHVKIDRWWQWPGTALLIAEEYSKFLFSVARSRLAPT